MTDEIKKAFESATTDEEKKGVFEKYKDTIRTLTEEELDSVTGGSWLIWDSESNNQQPEAWQCSPNICPRIMR